MPWIARLPPSRRSSPRSPISSVAAQPNLNWCGGLLASLFIANLLLVILNLPLAPVWARLLRIPRPYLYSGILLFAALGVYSVG